MIVNGRGAMAVCPGKEFAGQRFVADGNWHHLVATYDDTTGERLLYVDGELGAKDMARGRFRENAYPCLLYTSQHKWSTDSDGL